MGERAASGMKPIRVKLFSFISYNFFCLYFIVQYNTDSKYTYFY